MTEQSEGRVRLDLTLIFLLSTHKGQYYTVFKNDLSAAGYNKIITVIINPPIYNAP